MIENPLQSISSLDWAEPVLPPPVLMQNVSAQRKSILVLSEVDCWVEAGEIVGILGPGGAGKTTLIETILGWIKPKEGLVEVFGRKPRRLDRKRIRLGYAPEVQADSGRYPVTVMEVVLSGAHSLQSRFLPYSKETTLYAQYLVSQFQLDHAKRVLISRLSAGERQCVHLARALVTKPNLLLLDDPTRGLDPSQQQRLQEVLQDLRDQTALSVILTTANPRFAVQCCDRILGLNQTVRWDCEASDVNKEMVTQLFHCEVDFRKPPQRSNPRPAAKADRKSDLKDGMGTIKALPELRTKTETESQRTP